MILQFIENLERDADENMGKKKRTKWRKLSLGSLSDEQKETSSGKESPETDKVTTDYNLNNECPYIYPSHVSEQYYQDVQYIQTLIDPQNVTFAQNNEQVQSFYPVYIPTLVPRINNVHNRLPTEYQYYYGLTYPFSYHPQTMYSNGNYCETSHQRHSSSSSSEPNMQQQSHSSSPHMYYSSMSSCSTPSEEGPIFTTFPGLGFCSKATNSTPFSSISSYEKRKRRKKKLKWYYIKSNCEEETPAATNNKLKIDEAVATSQEQKSLTKFSRNHKEPGIIDVPVNAEYLEGDVNTFQERITSDSINYSGANPQSQEAGLPEKCLNFIENKLGSLEKPQEPLPMEPAEEVIICNGIGSEDSEEESINAVEVPRIDPTPPDDDVEPLLTNGYSNLLAANHFIEDVREDSPEEVIDFASSEVLQEFVDGIVNDTVSSAQKLSLGLTTHRLAPLESWANQFVEKMLCQAQSEFKNRGHCTSAIASRRGQNIHPITITKQNPRTKRLPRNRQNSPHFGDLQLYIPTIYAYEPSFVDGMVQNILNGALNTVSSQRSKHIDQSCLQYEGFPDHPECEVKAKSMFEKLGNILMNQIMFDAQNEIIKRKKTRILELAYGNQLEINGRRELTNQTVPLEEVSLKIPKDLPCSAVISKDQPTRTTIKADNYRIAFGDEEWSENSLLGEDLSKRLQLENVEYNDILKKLREVEEHDVAKIQFDEFRKNRDEIMVYEASDCSECMSEDLEMLPHRYERSAEESAKKHIFVNQLSLATEMLRTDEDLPYDAQFKPLISPNDHHPADVPPQTNNSFILRKYYESLAKNVKSTKSQDRKPATDSGVHSDESDNEERAEIVSPWWKFRRNWGKTPGEHLLSARDDPFPTGFCCNLM